MLRPLQLTDEELVDCIRGRLRHMTATDAFTELYRRHCRALLAFLVTRSNRKEVDDLAQEVWQRLWKHSKSLTNDAKPQHFRGLAFQIARRLIIDNYRRTRKIEPLPENLPCNKEILDVERRLILEECFDKLRAMDPRMATVLQIRLAGEGYDAVQSALLVTRQTAYGLYHEAMKRIQACVGTESS
jgi:RNA polymerase sigma factor (sigma-70 family)